ncbi:hypothetical protein Q73_12905 [Bacillus coahuilensis m2-6]|nr:hypothetical protein Q73_12905 [Bacillus coahuilensis m2-6]
MICLFCHQSWVDEMSWVDFLPSRAPRVLCEDCAGQFQRLSGKRCETCSRELEGDRNACYDCHRWKRVPFWKDRDLHNLSLYQYNDFMKLYIARFKFRGDYRLSEAFHHEIEQQYRKLTFDIIVPIPLSKNRAEERRFNQVDALFERIGYSYQHLLTRTESEKQSKKSREERMNMVSNPFTCYEEIKQQRVLLVDDIYTTGVTVHSASEVLYRHGAKSVAVFTLVRG